MNRLAFLVTLSILSFGFHQPPASAAVFYSGVQNVPIPYTFDGIFFHIFTGTTSGTLPGTWATEPWLNPFFGGTAIGNSDLMRPVITGADQVLNLAMGTLVDASGNFAAGESGSATHVGAGLGQFALGVEGLMGFKFSTTTGGPLHYGWLRLVIENSGPGTIKDWAYDDVAGTGIQAGFTGAAFVPEPTRALLLLSGLLSILMRRRR